MGCVADKPLPPPCMAPQQAIHESTTPFKTPSLQLPLCDPAALINSKLIEAIKKRDIILFQRSVQQHEVKASEFIGSSEQAKTVLHKLAEYNFSEGMAYLLDEITLHKSTQVSRILNMKDIDGNTPLLLCCLSNAVETLEVLARNEFVDIEAKNFAKKSALEIALEMESPCINVLTSITGGELPTKATLKSGFSREGSQQFPSFNEDKGSNNDFDTRTSLDGRSGQTPSSRNLTNNLPSRAVMEARLDEVLKELEDSEKNFVDPEFPHEMWYLEDEEAEGSLLAQFPDLSWRRPSEFMNSRVKSPVLFDEFLPNLTTRTPLAGCEIYSALAVMAEYPQRLSGLFNTKEVTKQGAYSVNFTVSGTRIEILLDDYLPSKDGSQLLFSQPADNELWFSLLEKAFAKLHGGYNGLESVGILEALETLTGMPVAQKSLKDVDDDKIWVKLVEYDKRNYIMCAGEIRRYHTAFRNRFFTVVNVIECQGHKLVKLRNHFQDFTWEGDFSAKSPLWTKELREEVGYHEMDTTSFFMSLKDFTREFDFLTVCHYHESWSRHTVNTHSESNHANYYELTIEKETEAYISVHQKHPKFVDEESRYEISPIEMILAKDLDGKVFENIAVGERDAFLGKPTAYIHESHRVKLDAGKYIFYVKARWLNNKKHDFIVNVLSSVPTKFTEIEPEQCVDFLEKLYMGTGQLAKNHMNLANNCKFASGWSGSHLWMHATNLTNKIWHLEVTFEKMVNLKLGKKHRAMSDTIKFVIPPGQKAAAYAKRTNPGAVIVAWNFTQRLE